MLSHGVADRVEFNAANKAPGSQRQPSTWTPRVSSTSNITAALPALPTATTTATDTADGGRHAASSLVSVAACSACDSQ